MIVVGIAAAAITVIGVAESIRLLATDGRGRVPTRTYPHLLDLR